MKPLERKIAPGQRLRVSLRGLLLLTAIAAVALALPIRKAIRQSQAKQWVADQGGHIAYDYSFDGNHFFQHANVVNAPKWAVDTFGIDFFATVETVVLDRDEVTELEPLQGLSGLRSLAIFIEIGNNLDFSPLASISSFEELHIHCNDLNDERLARICAALPGVRITVDNELISSPAEVSQ